MDAELAERLEVLRRIGERGLRLAQSGAFFPARVLPNAREEGEIGAHSKHLDLWQHLLDELKVMRECADEIARLRQRVKSYEKLEAACREWRPISKGIAMENGMEPYDDPIVWALEELDK